MSEVIAILRGSKSIPEGKEKLIERFGLSEVQADYVVNMTLGKLTGLERQKIDDELAALIETIKALNEILNNEDKILQIIKEESLEIKEKFDNPRRSEIAAVSGEVDIEDLIPQEDCVLTYTHFGYIKRQPVDVYKIQKRGGRGVSGLTRRDEDFVTELFVCSSHDYVMFFSTKGKVYRLKCYEIPEGSRVSRGTNIINLLPLEEDEKISSMIKISEYNEGNYLVMVTRKGIIKRTDVTAYDTARKGGLKAITIDEDDELAWVRLTDGNSNLIIGTKLGRAIKFNENDARPLSRTARGVKAITLSKNDEVVGMERVRENATILTVTEKGQGRKTELDQYRLQSRGGKGITNYKITEKSGIVAGIKIIDENDDAIMITDEGVIIRIHSKDINTLSRYASGVRVMRVGENTKIVTVAKAEHEDEIDSEEEICETDETTADIDGNVENIEKTDADTIIQTNGENVSE
ncbi:MAG: DNA gyrase C-terminal beta-propeller domain-containing protein [Clostridia bacterium]